MYPSPSGAARLPMRVSMGLWMGPRSVQSDTNGRPAAVNWRLRSSGFAGAPLIIINGACQIGLVAASVLSAFELLSELHRLNVRREPGHAVDSVVGTSAVRPDPTPLQMGPPPRRVAPTLRTVAQCTREVRRQIRAPSDEWRRSRAVRGKWTRGKSLHLPGSPTTRLPGRTGEPARLLRRSGL